MEDCFMSVPPSHGMNSRQSCKVAFAAWSVVGDWREPERRRSSASASLVQRKVRRRHVVTTALDKNGQSVQCMLSRTRNQCKPRSLSLYLWFFFADKKTNHRRSFSSAKQKVRDLEGHSLFYTKHFEMTETRARFLCDSGTYL